MQSVLDLLGCQICKEDSKWLKEAIMKKGYIFPFFHVCRFVPMSAYFVADVQCTGHLKTLSCKNNKHKGQGKVPTERGDSPAQKVAVQDTGSGHLLYGFTC